MGGREREDNEHNFRWLLLSVCMGAFISHFTAGVVNVSLPGLSTIFHKPISTVQWITTGYLLIITAVLPLMGKLGDRIGYRNVHNAGYILFTVSSLLIALSPNISYLLTFRVFQAIGSSMYQATNIAIVMMHLPAHQRGKGLGYLSAAVATGAMVGPVAGGYVFEWLGWKWLFLIQVPVGLVASLLAYRFIPKDPWNKKSKIPFDYIGALLFILSLSSIVFGVSGGNSWGWFSSVISGSILFGLFGIMFMIFWLKKQKDPFLPLIIFRNRLVTAGLITSTTSFMSAFSAQVVLPFYLIGLLHLSASQSGFIMMSYPLALCIFGTFAGNGSDRFGSLIFIFSGLFCAFAASIGLIFLSENTIILYTILFLALLGIGLGFVNSPNNSLIMNYIPTEHMGAAAGLIALSRNLGLVFGTAIGLGFLQKGKNPEMTWDIHGFQTVFSINATLCLACIVLLYSGIRFNKSLAQKTGEA